MFESIKRKITYFIIKRKYSHDKNAVSFKKFYSESKEILITIPSQAENFTAVKKLLTQLKSDNKKITLFLKDDHIAIEKNDKEISLITYSAEKLTRFYLPDMELEDRIKRERFDLFIDLDLNESLLNYAVACLCKAKFLTGFQKDMSDRFYNFQIPSMERNYEISYGILLNSLRMF